MTLPPLPSAFLATLGELPGLDGLAEALDTPAAVSVRLNRAKTGAVLPSPVPWAPDSGYYLADRPAFTFDPALHQGVYYVQDASSMATAAAIATAVAALPDAGEPLRFLDACAAPGGKTIGAMDALPANTFIVANEYSRQRAPILAENLAKWGTRAPIVTRDDASAITGLDGFFDIIAADVPCSGEGMMRKEAEARRQWSPALVADCAALQQRIAHNLWDALRPGGYLVYSTCAFNRHENEEVILSLIDTCGAEPVAIPALDSCPQILGAQGADFPAYRFVPGRVRGEGLFLCLLRKPGDSPAASLKAVRPPKPHPAAAWLADGYTVSQHGDTLCALPTAHVAAAQAIDRRMQVMTPGIEIATVKGRDLIPAQPLATSTALRPDAFPRVDVDASTALAYLGRNAITLPAGAPRGLVLLTCDTLPLGFVKNLGNRANNLYPAPWRILTQSPAPTRILPQ